MFYCPNCNNIYDITKTVPLAQSDDQSRMVLVGGEETSETPITVSSDTKPDNIIILIDKLIKNEPIKKELYEKLNLNTITKHTAFKKLQSKHKELVINKLAELLPQDASEQKASQIASPVYFMCANCKNVEKIKAGTVITRKLYGESAADDTSKFKHMVNAHYLPFTRKYVCPNNKCPSITDHSKREAVFFRMANSFKVVYVCKACEQTWTS